MKKTKTNTLSHSFIRSHYVIASSLMWLLDRSSITNSVKKHCKIGLKVIGIMYANLCYNTGTHLLSKQEFDGFFKLFPTAYFNNRELISVNMIIENIAWCIKTNDIVNVDWE